MAFYLYKYSNSIMFIYCLLFEILKSVNHITTNNTHE